MKFRSLLCLALIHTLVDCFAQFLSPLWPGLKESFDLSPWAFTAMFAVWQASTSVSQPLFGYWGDRFGSRWMVWLGPGLAIVCISLLGFVGNPVLLTGLLMVGGLGIGAFHPEAAVNVVEAAGTRPTNGLAIFTFGGMLGLGIGPFLSGTLTKHAGLTSLAWLLVPGLLLLGVLTVLRQPVEHHALPQEPGLDLAGMLRGRWGSVGLLLAVATLRVVPALGVPMGMAFLLDHQGIGKDEIGRLQSLFLLSGGLGTLACPLLTRPGREIAALVGTTLPAAGCLWLLTWDQPLLYFAGLIGSGLLVQGAIPIMIAYSQRLLPRGQRLAASLTLGTSWGVGGLIVAGLQAYFSATGNYQGMLAAMIPFALATAVGSALLPRIAHQSASLAVPVDPEAKVETQDLLV